MASEPSKKYYDYVHTRIDWYSGAADRNMRIYTGLRIALVLAGATLPFVAAQDWKFVAGLFGVFVAAATGLEGFFRPGEKWQLFRSAQLALTRAARRFEHVLVAIPQDERNLSNTDYKVAYEAFVSTTDEIMRAESEQYWKTAVADQVQAKQQNQD